MSVDAQPIHWCELCNKPFTKQSALKRHRYYCRSRAGTSSTRLRSCISCARGKTGCDQKQPQCSRCVSKGIACHYPTVRAIAKQSSKPTRDGRNFVSMPTPEAETQALSGWNLNGDLDMLLDDPSFLLAPHVSDVVTNYAPLEFFNVPDYLDLQPENVCMPPNVPINVASSLSSREHSHHVWNSSRLNLKVDGERQSLDPFAHGMPRAPPTTVRVLVGRPKLSPASQRVGELILHTLKSYPRMLRSDDIPPFIHSSFVSLNDQNSDFEPLTNCIGLIHMISAKSTRKLLWQNVRNECERFQANYRNVSKWKTLAAMQALFLYTLIRLDEGETEYNNLDNLLVQTIIILSQRISNNNTPCPADCIACQKGSEITWEDWIFRESRRRLAIVYRVVNKLIYFDPVSKCDLPAEFILAPLPAKRQLWEAGNEHSWKAEISKEPRALVSFGLASSGEIVQLNDGRLSCHDNWLPNSYLSPSSQGSTTPSASNESPTELWEEWCTGIDGFGGLVMLAASLIL